MLQSCHLAMIDTLMMAYTVEMVSVERVLSCVQRYCPLFPDEDIPYDAEDAVTIWLNKVSLCPQPPLPPPPKEIPYILSGIRRILSLVESVAGGILDSQEATAGCSFTPTRSLRPAAQETDRHV